MRRREFITVIAGVVTYPVASHAQQSIMPLIGFLNSASAGQWEHLVDAFRDGLNDAGFVDGRNSGRQQPTRSNW